MNKRAGIGWGVAIAAAVAVGAGLFINKQREPAAKGPGAPMAAASGASGPGAGGGPPVSVTTVKAEQRDQVVALEATGTVTSLNTVEVRPQVSSMVTGVHVKEGQFVKRGELLFTLDSRNDEVNLTKAKAQLAKDQAALADARRQLERNRDLLRQQFISQSAVDTSQTLVESQQAVAAASTAAVAAAQVALGYNRITAQSAGRVGAVNVFPGSYVTPAGAVLLTITQLDPIAVSFNLPQRNLADALAGLREGKLPVTAQLPDTPTGRGATLKGRLQFVDSAVDVASGTVKVKAVFENDKQQLWPGAYVNVRMGVQTLKDAIVVPIASVITTQRGRQVYVVEPGNKAAVRKVELVYSAGADAVVTGVKPGERVVVDGRQNVRPGSTVIERAAEPGRGASRPGGGASQPAAGPASADGGASRAPLVAGAGSAPGGNSVNAP
jgi:RND family efflux transporter MFP subunit